MVLQEEKRQVRKVEINKRRRKSSNKEQDDNKSELMFVLKDA